MKPNPTLINYKYHVIFAIFYIVFLIFCSVFIFAGTYLGNNLFDARGQSDDSSIESDYYTVFILISIIISAIITYAIYRKCLKKFPNLKFKRNHQESALEPSTESSSLQNKKSNGHEPTWGESMGGILFLAGLLVIIVLFFLHKLDSEHLHHAVQLIEILFIHHHAE
jgi:hypothetical protein